MAPDSATVTSPSVITGDLPSGCTSRSSGGASIVLRSRSYFRISYGTPSSSSSQSTRCERELFRWWTVIIGAGSEVGTALSPTTPIAWRTVRLTRRIEGRCAHRPRISPGCR